MARWKLCRQIFGTETFSLTEGDEVTLGRGLNNTITLSSLVISRAHCIINVRKNEISITDLNSSNGVYAGTKRIPPNIPFVINDSDVIGIGWTTGVALGKIEDNEKFIFKVVKEQPPVSIINRITFQSDDEFENIEQKIAQLDCTNPENEEQETKLNMKRKIGFEGHSNVIPEKIIKKEINESCHSDQIINILSDSDTEVTVNRPQNSKKTPKLEPVPEEPQKAPCNGENGINLKTENEYLEYEAFNVKQEYIGYDDEPIPIDSDSDSESEHWYLRLSQSSPGKPFIMLRDKSVDAKPEDSSYSQMDDDLGCNAFAGHENDYIDDAVLQTETTDEINNLPELTEISFQVTRVPEVDIQRNTNKDNTIINQADNINKAQKPQLSIPTEERGRDEIDGFNLKEVNLHSSKITELDATIKKAQMIQALNQIPKKKTSHTVLEKKKKSSSKYDKKSKHSSKKHNVSLSNSQKEERKRKLKEIAEKEKGETSKTSKGEDKLIKKVTEEVITAVTLPCEKMNNNKSVSNIKVTSSNRQAFLTETVKSVKKKESPQRSETKGQKGSPSSKLQSKAKSPDQSENIDNTKKPVKTTEQKDSKVKNNSKSNFKVSNSKNCSNNNSIIESREPLKNLKPLISSINTIADPQPKKSKKRVQFSEEKPEIIYFEIEDGNRMKKTSLVKTTLLDNRQMPIFSLEKITLMKILRWNPHWLEEQINNNEPPPILGHSNPPLAIFHSFNSHSQYVQLIGDLLLMEIWECLSIGYAKIRGQNIGLRMVIASLPPVPTHERLSEIFNFSVDVTLPTSEVRNLPRVGEILLVSFGPENSRHQRFFFVNNVRCLPSPSSNRNSFYNISLQAIFSDKMRLLRPGEVMVGISLAYIHKELSLFEAMAYMAGSPLSEAILRPQPCHFIRDLNPAINMKSQWTMTLNPSQQVAVASSVSAALGDQPCIQMVQGPPGTGKSSVICAIVMSYFYDSHGKKQQNRGKVLICATSNAAVDELVIRLLQIRQSLPTAERFRMVRVGRVEAMHPRARDVSSQQLAQRDAARLQQEPQHRPGLNEEIVHIEAKINMWKTQAQDAAAKGVDSMRVAYCQGRITELVKRIALLRTGGGGPPSGEELRPEQLIATERRIIEGADIVVTTLASAQNYKIKGLKRRIALCIVDEAGQAIEPEALIPLTLDVTKLTLIGDPQQLPGYICSQRAKKHGLGESLFSRLAGCSEAWNSGSPVVLLSEQYRMHEHIADYPNRAFYGGRVSSAPQRRPALPVPPYCLVGISSGDKGQNASGANDMEAWGVSRLVAALSAALRGLGLSLAVITPYHAHKELIKKYLKTLMDPAEGPVEVNTVDSFQGQERDVMVVSLARSHGVGFLTDAGRMNVMLTRARHALLVCLNPQAVLKHYQWRTLLEDAQRRKLYRTLPYKMCQATGQIPNDEILRHVSI